MKVGKLLSVAVIVLGITGCNLDFSNKSEDKWIVTNNASIDVNVQFNETTVTIQNGVTKTIEQPYDATISVENNDTLYHVNYETSYDYSGSKSVRTLLISPQKKYEYVITNNLETAVTFSLPINTYVVIIPDSSTITRVDDKDNEKTIYTIPANTTVTEKNLIVYKTSLSFTFYQGTTAIPEYQIEQHADEKYYITIK